MWSESVFHGRLTAETAIKYGAPRDTEHPELRQPSAREVWESAVETLTPGSKITMLTTGPLTTLADIIQSSKNATSMIQVCRKCFPENFFRFLDSVILAKWTCLSNALSMTFYISWNPFSSTNFVVVMSNISPGCLHRWGTHKPNRDGSRKRFHHSLQQLRRV